jgi:predicted nucleic acid-binding protein
MSPTPVQALVDSTVLVDLLRKYPPATTWLATQPKLGTSNIAWMELIFGAQNKAAQQQSLQVLSLFEVVYLTEADMRWAMRQLLQNRLKYSVKGWLEKQMNPGITRRMYEEELDNIAAYLQPS